MKMIIAVAALTAVIASPAFAAPARGAPAQANPTVGPRYEVNRSYDVYVNGRYIGSDPDRSVRFELRRDYDMNDY